MLLHCFCFHPAREPAVRRSRRRRILVLVLVLVLVLAIVLVSTARVGGGEDLLYIVGDLEQQFVGDQTVEELDGPVAVVEFDLLKVFA